MRPTFIGVPYVKHEYRKKHEKRIDVYEIRTSDTEQYLQNVWFFTYNIYVNKWQLTEIMNFLEHNQLISDKERPADFNGYYYHKDPRCYIRVVGPHY